MRVIASVSSIKASSSMPVGGAHRDVGEQAGQARGGWQLACRVGCLLGQVGGRLGVEVAVLAQTG
jgi:hypothetical protein